MTVYSLIWSCSCTFTWFKNKLISIQYGGKINTDFHGKKLLKEGSHCVCLSLVFIDSFSKINKNITQRKMAGNITEVV